MPKKNEPYSRNKEKLLFFLVKGLIPTILAFIWDIQGIVQLRHVNFSCFSKLQIIFELRRSKLDCVFKLLGHFWIAQVEFKLSFLKVIFKCAGKNSAKFSKLQVIFYFFSTIFETPGDFWATQVEFQLHFR